jgi:hypothetical protein
MGNQRLDVHEGAEARAKPLDGIGARVDHDTIRVVVADDGQVLDLFEESRPVRADRPSGFTPDRDDVPFHSTTMVRAIRKR